MRLVRVQADTIDAEREISLLRGNRCDIGAVVTFMGYCRDEAGTLAALELEHFPGMAEAELERIAADAEDRWPLLGVVAIHRFGMIRPGEPAHRAAAFAAADFLMDFMKTDAPFWKREHRRDAISDPGVADSWVAAKTTDATARDRWR